MKRTSSPVRSSQAAAHRRLEEVVLRNLSSTWKQPLHPPTVTAFEKLMMLAEFDKGMPLILDSGCGTGDSTKSITAQYPDSLVIGIDRSTTRLGRRHRGDFPFRMGNLCIIQAELSSFWRLALEWGWRLQRHFLLFPNPSPKPGQLQRRWHAHPVFPRILELGGTLEMRCNWEIYAEEFLIALNLARPDAEAKLELADSEKEWGGVSTPFGLKYSESGHSLYRVVVDLG